MLNEPVRFSTVVKRIKTVPLSRRLKFSALQLRAVRNRAIRLLSHWPEQQNNLQNMLGFKQLLGNRPRDFAVV
jgi:hypothetical protein